MNKRSVLDLSDKELVGKRALVRLDLNVPLNENGEITDDTRIRASIPTIQYLLSKSAKPVLLSHLGRPKGTPNPKYSLSPVAARLAELLGSKVCFVESTDSDEAIQASHRIEKGEVLLLENTRFLSGEESNDPALSRQLAELGDLFVNDAFGAAHRAHASTEGVAHFLKPAVAGLLLKKELDYLGSALSQPKRPFVAILGGSKISGKIDVIREMLPKVDSMLIGGAMACTFFKAMGLEVGKSLVEDDRVEMAKELIAESGDKLILPIDATVSTAMDNTASTHNVDRSDIPATEAMFDVGPKSAELFASKIRDAKTVVWNGPMGVFEKPPFDASTLAVANAMADATANGAITIVGGGDSAAAVNVANLDDKMTHISTGGGASLEFLEGKPLPGVVVLDSIN